MPAQFIPVLPDAAELAGEWSVAGQGAEVRLHLLAAPVAADGPAAAAWSLRTITGSLNAFGLERVCSWRPTPDGIELAGRDGLAVIFFAREAADRYSGAFGGERLGLTRLSHDRDEQPR